MHVTEETLDGYAHCIDFVCPGYGQEPVKAIKTVRHDTVGDRGGDGALAMVVENTWEYLRFDDPEKVSCPHCGGTREVALQARPTYQNLSGFAQNGLVQVAKFDANVRNSPADEAAAAESAAQAARIAELEQQMADLMNAMTKDA
jgi:hypothetical protein